jgi:hypothetical protein
MSDKPDSEYKHHDAAPGSSADRSARTAVPDTFPASDPVATTAAVGARAVDPAEMMDAEPQVNIPDGATVSARFADQVSAKLALERLVREIPLDRRGANLSSEGEAHMLEVTAPRADIERVAEMLRKTGGEGC